MVRMLGCYENLACRRDRIDVRFSQLSVVPNTDQHGRRPPHASRFTVSEEGALICPDPMNHQQLHVDAQDGVSRELLERTGNTLRVFSDESRFLCQPNSDMLSSHGATCRLLGNKKFSGSAYRLHVGDLIRLGSVGFVVSAICDGDKSKQLSVADVERIKLEMSARDEKEQRAEQEEDDAALTDIEDDEDPLTPCTQAVTAGEPPAESAVPLCYICYDPASAENPLVSPCQCKGDTKYVHYNCLQNWHLNGKDDQICLETSNVEGVSSCSVCKQAFRSRVKTSNGDTVSLVPKLKPPTISLVVVTSHEHEPQLTNMHYQLSFASLLCPSNPQEAIAPIKIGRSTTQCHMSVKYRTVSSCHAQIMYTRGKFFLSDLKSSNGTMVLMRTPFELEYGVPVHVKMYRTIVTLQAKRKFSWKSIACRCWKPRLVSAVLPSPAPMQGALEASAS